MTRQQFKILLTKIRSNLDHTVFENSGDKYIKRMKSTFPNGIVDINLYSDRFNVEVKTASGSTSFGKLEFFLGKPILSLSWWRWRSLCHLAEEDHKRNMKRDKENSKRFEIEDMDRAIIETFPDVLEDQIFGDD